MNQWTKNRNNGTRATVYWQETQIGIQINEEELELDSFFFGSEMNKERTNYFRIGKEQSWNPNPKTKKSLDPLRIGNRRTRCGRLWPPVGTAARGWRNRRGTGARGAGPPWPAALAEPAVATGARGEETESQFWAPHAGPLDGDELCLGRARAPARGPAAAPLSRHDGRCCW
jgi:hypothetical protein